MKLKYKFTYAAINGVIHAVPVGKGAENFNAIMKINQTAKDVMELLQKEMTEEELIDSMAGLYEEASREEISLGVRKSIACLAQNHLLENS